MIDDQHMTTIRSIAIVHKSDSATFHYAQGRDCDGAEGVRRLCAQVHARGHPGAGAQAAGAACVLDQVRAGAALVGKSTAHERRRKL